MKSLGAMLEQIHGLCDTKDVNTWENDFIKSCMGTYGPRKLSCQLSGRQAEVIDRIWRKHFA